MISKIISKIAISNLVSKTSIKISFRTLIYRSSSVVSFFFSPSKKLAPKYNQSMFFILPDGIEFWADANGKQFSDERALSSDFAI